MKKTKTRRMSCHNGNIPMRQELVLFYRKKHYFSMEQAKYGGLGLMILDESLYFGGMFEKSIVQGRKYGTAPIRESFWGPQKRDYLAKTEVHLEGWRMTDIIFEQQLFRASI